MARHLLRGDEDVFEISSSYTSRTAEIFSVILKSLGLELEFIDEEEILEEYDDEQLKLFEYDDIEYLCTEYDFMLIRRKKDIEKELLNKYGVIDKDELETLVMEEMKSRNYINGPDKSEYDTLAVFAPDTVDE